MTEFCVHLVDDELAVRRSVGFMLKTAGMMVETYASGEEFLKAVAGVGHGCILLDVRLDGMDGLAVQQALKDRGITVPVVLISGHGDIGLAVRAMKAGAIDFIEKPFEKATLLAAIEQARVHGEGQDHVRRLADAAKVQLNALTPRERDVLDGLVDGHSNKVVAYELGISPRTVEIHRANLMTKLGVASLSEALRIAFAARLGSLGDQAGGADSTPGV
jgi:two-component system response regulator FixJ